MSALKFGKERARIVSSNNPGRLWKRYCLEASKARPDAKAASAAWDSWLAVYLPDEAQRYAIPKPRWLA